MTTSAAKLVLAKDRNKVAAVQPGKPLTIGTGAANSLCLANAKGVSVYHAVVRYSEINGWLVCDWQSNDGTYLNGQRVYQCRPLENGDEIQLGILGPILFFELHSELSNKYGIPAASIPTAARKPTPANQAQQQVNAKAQPNVLDFQGEVVETSKVVSVNVQSMPIHPNMFSWWLLMCLGGLLLLPFPFLFWPLEIGAFAAWIILGSRKIHSLVIELRDGRALRHSFANLRTANSHCNGIRKIVKGETEEK